ncbi:peptide chain release factor 2 [Acetobacteraceae bacterium]|nr:peptide chain release factor 2 [Acetobacteraceae bacterium]
MSAESEFYARQIQQSLVLLRRHLNWDESQDRLAELNHRAEDPDLWQNPSEAEKLMKERTLLDTRVKSVLEMAQGLKDNLDFIEMAEAEDDQEVIQESLKALSSIRDRAAKAEIESLLSGEADSNDCYLEINAGAGGTEAQDWSQMMMRMYLRWGEANGYKLTVLESSDGEQAGIKSVTLRFEGLNAYGWLKTESGVHRLVRISPFDSAARRHTSFASVWVYPVVDDSIEIEILDSDLRVDTFRASGAGGQHINKTDSAIRITHEPTGIVVACQTDRSQHRNRATAMQMLRARLYEAELQRREAEAAETEAGKTEIGWGHQIRSYVLAPYQMVKDLRTGVEKTNPDAVLDGDLSDFMAAALAAKMGGDEK